MAAAVENGLLVLADITGYTAYLSRGEIEHAPTIAGDLLETVVGRLEPPFRLAKLEGDAVFVFAEDGRAEPSLLLDSIEAAYFAFRRRLRSIEGATSCDCNACGLAPRLDLKLFVHHGAYVHSRIAGRDELAGADVILAHRLLKGSTASSGRDGSFVLFTDAAMKALGSEARALGPVSTVELLEKMAPIEAFVVDLEARWQADSQRRQLDHAERQLVLEERLVLPVEQSTAWSYLTRPTERATWEGPISFAHDDGGLGRVGPGTRTRCVTGRLSSIEEIVDWQPFDHVGWRVAVPGIGPVEATADLTAGNSSTTVSLRWSVAGDQPANDATLADFAAAKQDALARLTAALQGRRT